MEHYPALVRLAHLILPPHLGRHRRVLAAHALVQRGLGRSGAGAYPGAGGPRSTARDTAGDTARDTEGSTAGSKAAPTAGIPRSRTGEEPARSAHDWLRARVVRDALRPPVRVTYGATLPKMLGLRVFPRAGGTDELALDRALAAAEPATRAALALTALEGLAPAAVSSLLRGAGVAAPERAVGEAERLRAACAPDLAELLRRPEFDPCTVHLRPTDLLRRGRRVRWATLAAAVVLLAGTGAAVLGGSPASPARPAGSAVREGTAPVRTVRVPPDRWADTSRVDFTAWPARGDRTGDQALLGRALTEGTGGAALVAGSEPPSLLYAGTVDGTAVVLLHTGRTLLRYTEPGAGNGRPSLAKTPADAGDVTTAAAVVLARAGNRTGNRTRYLLAPWVAEAGTRDLRTPGSAARALRVAADGVTEPVTSPEPRTAPAACGEVPVLQLRSSRRIVEDHAFLLADLGGLVAAHLTWTPLPVAGEPARRPREATGPLGLAAWAHSACSLTRLRDGGVRSVNRWEFAAQPLPENAGRALWICSRADTWDGRGTADVTLEVPGRSLPVTTVRDTAACGRFGQDVLAGSYWTGPAGSRYVLAAASRRVVGVTAGGAASVAAQGRLLAARVTGTAPLRLVGRLPDGSSLTGWSGWNGGT